jgi:hypothetical protein
MKTLLPPFKGITDSLLLCFKDGGSKLLQYVGKFLQDSRTSNDIGTGKGNGEISNGLCLERVTHCCGQADKCRKIAGQIQIGVLIKIE